MSSIKGQNDLPSDDQIKQKLRAEYTDAVDSLIELHSEYTAEELEQNFDEMFQNALSSDRIVETEGVKDQSAFWGSVKKFLKTLPK